MDAFRNEPIEVLVVVPLFLAKVCISCRISRDHRVTGRGDKGQFDMNGKNIPLLYADPIGSDPLLADLMIKNAERVLSTL